jgi:hypothetical protein
MTAAAIAASSAREMVLGVGYTHAFWIYIVGNVQVRVVYT